MPRFLTIGYGDRAGYDATPQELLDAAHAHDARLVGAGATTAILAEPVQVSNTHGHGTRVEKGPYMQSPLPVAGFSLLEAESLDEAVALVAQTPCAVASGVVEVWPLEDSPSGA